MRPKSYSAPEAPAGAETLERAELRARALSDGLAGLDDAQALQLALSRVAGARAAELAAALLARFGSLPEVLGAPAPELRQVAPATVAAELRLWGELQARALRAPFRSREVLSSWPQVRDYLRAAMAAAPREQFRVLFLDRKNRLIADEVMGWGSVDHAPVYPREVVRRALELNASALVLAHNHPSGDPTPSSADIDMTRQVVEAARALGLQVHDHLVVGAASVASLRALGVM